MLLSVGLGLGLGTWALLALSLVALGVVASSPLMAGTSGACSPIDGIAKALRECGACGPTPPSGNWVIADRIDGTRARPGGQVQVRWDGGTTPVQDSEGRHAHIAGLWFRGTVQLEVTAATNDAVSAYQLRSLWTAIFLEDLANWQYLSDVDGRHLTDDVWFRHWQHLQHQYLQAGVQGNALPIITTDSGLGKDVGVGLYELDFSVYFPLPTLGAGHSKLQGLLPLAAVQRYKNGGLKFRMASEIAGAPANVEVVQFFQPTEPEEAGVEMWVDLAYLPTVVVDSGWQTDSYTQPDLSAILQHPERKTEFAWVRHYPEDAEDFQGQLLAGGYGGVTLQVAGFNILGGENNDMLRDRGLAFAMSIRDSAFNRDNAAQDLPLVDVGTGTPLALALLPFRARAGAAAGDVAYRFNQRTGTQQTRFAHRTNACHNARRAAKIARATKCGPCVGDVPVLGEDGSPNVGPNEPMILRLRRFNK